MGYPFRRKYLLTNTVVQPVQWDEMGLFFTAHWFCLKKGRHQLQGWSSIFFHVVFGYNSFWDKPRLWETSLGRFKIGVFFFSHFLKKCVYIYIICIIFFFNVYLQILWFWPWGRPSKSNRGRDGDGQFQRKESLLNHWICKYHIFWHKSNARWFFDFLSDKVAGEKLLTFSIHNPLGGFLKCSHLVLAQFVNLAEKPLIEPIWWWVTSYTTNDWWRHKH